MTETNDDGALKNTVIGTYAMQDSLGASYENTFIGYGAGGGAWTGSPSIRNTGIGRGVMSAAMDAGNDNTAVGHGALDLLTTGNDNACFGSNAGNSITDGGTNTMIGVGTDVASSGNDNSSAFGNGAIGAGTNTISIGNTSVSTIAGQVSFSTYSDKRIKKDIEDTNIGLDFIKELKPRKFKRVCAKDYPEVIQTKYDKTAPDLTEPDRVVDGLIAQEVKETMDSMGVSFSGWNEDDNSKQKLQYATFIMPLIKAVQELTAKVEALEDAQ